ncbi:NAD(P)H dehydrogenase (quinone) [Roseivivax halotolerans]|jgi:NAD(P)H dehydrogenase (quinone)|uniref:NAD(P)H dehydrogenase (Quinone) n=1 Tax=Roseivivax halotolerans TaxID=93684 RepID=A0A1I5XTW0_9RHOB|nr:MULTISPECIES: NAD(P)H-dependent oxidoreductase [Roseivivax]QFT62349.1 NAD(P)H dehydrogenase (quinone) [Roseivivax sp. THAF30]SFQ35167.1 NAD(P)H dehydrogenase (quinone) [Roseivivax halotolerans]
MSAPKIAVIFYSTYGTNHAIAKEAEAALKEAGAEVRLRRIAETAPKEVVESQDAWKEQLDAMSDIPEVSHDDMLWADGYFFSSPTRYGSVTSQMRAFIDTLGPIWQEGKLVNKTVTATTSAKTLHGGHETTLLGFYTSTMHWGAIPVTPAYADPIQFEAGGNPYGVSVVAGEFDDKLKQAVAAQAKRLVDVTSKIIA